MLTVIPSFSSRRIKPPFHHLSVVFIEAVESQSVVDLVL